MKVNHTENEHLYSRYIYHVQEVTPHAFQHSTPQSKECNF